MGAVAREGLCHQAPHHHPSGRISRPVCHQCREERRRGTLGERCQGVQRNRVWHSEEPQREEDGEALTQQQIDASDAKKAETQRQKDAELAKQRQEQELEEQNIRARQERFNTNVANSFTDPEERKDFLQRVQFVASKGFGDLLDANPAASEYLLGSPNGPRVLNKIIRSKEEFNRVFPVTGISSLEQFYELKRIENDIARERMEAQQRQQAEQVPERLRDLAPRNPAPAVRLGKPGAQGQAGGDPMSDPKARRDYVRKLMGI